MKLELPLCFVAALSLTLFALAAQEKEPLFKQPLDTNIPHVLTDKSVRYDYDIVYVRAHRAGDKIHKRYYTDFSQPVTMEPGADLMLLHPDGKEELLVAGGTGSITDPMVSFNGEWVYYVHLYNLQKANQWTPSRQGADIFKIHVKSRRIVRLTNQRFTPNTGAAEWSNDYRVSQQGKSHFEYGVFNMGPCPLPGNRIIFSSNRDGFRPSKGYPAIALQLFVMDDSDKSIGDEETPQNLEKIGHFNIAGALHPVVLADGRVMFSTLESQGIRSEISWGIWTIHPDGSNWAPLVSAFDTGGAANGFHFQTQLSDGSLVVEEYYNQNNSGFGAYIKMPPQVTFSPAHMSSPRNPALRFGRFDNGKGKYYRMPFMPEQAVSFTPFALNNEGPADRAVLGDKTTPAVGKFTHPSGAPDNHMLTVYSSGPVNHQYTYLPQLDGGIYLLKGGEIVNEPAQLRLIKNDPEFNESWPRALVPYSRNYGVKEPKQLVSLVNNGKLNKHLPEGTPFGLVGTSSLYKRESYPNGVVRPDSVTSVYSGGNDPWRGLDAFTSHGNGISLNLHNQGGDIGLYENKDIHAIRILAMEPTTDRKGGANSGRRFYNHSSERLRILGEFPIRKFGTRAAGVSEMVNGQPKDPDGQPDTSFLAKIPADTAFTFQTLDVRGMVLNTSQTWHQLRPGELRADCGGCHAHSQKPTDFNLTLAAKPGYEVWDLVNNTPLLTTKVNDTSKQKWDIAGMGGLRQVKKTDGQGIVSPEYLRDIQPILQRSCVVCHSKQFDKPAGQLVLDADDEQIQNEQHGKFPGTYYRLALDERAKFGHKPIGYDSWGYPNASRYIRKQASRRSLLVWKIFGERLDGFSNDDHPSESEPGSGFYTHKGEKVPTDKNRHRYDLDFTGSEMPPAAAIAGKAKNPAGDVVTVPPLSDEERFTLLRWIDLGCPIDLDTDKTDLARLGFGWRLDDNRPVLALTEPRSNANPQFDRILVGMHDYYSGLDPASFTVTANFEVAGLKAGDNLAAKFKPKSQGVWELKLPKPISQLSNAKLIVSVKDKQGNWTRIERDFSVGKPAQTAQR